MSAKSSAPLSCGRCGKSCHYLWRYGFGYWCRACMAKAGVKVAYPYQAAMRFGGRVPAN